MPRVEFDPFNLQTQLDIKTYMIIITYLMEWL